MQPSVFSGIFYFTFLGAEGEREGMLWIPVRMDSCLRCNGKNREHFGSHGALGDSRTGHGSVPSCHHTGDGFGHQIQAQLPNMAACLFLPGHQPAGCSPQRRRGRSTGVTPQICPGSPSGDTETLGSGVRRECQAVLVTAVREICIKFA
jgi:hypothetical protein